MWHLRQLLSMKALEAIMAHSRRRIQCQGKEAPMTLSPLAGKPAPKDTLVDLARLEREYYACQSDVGDPTQRSCPWSLRLHTRSLPSDRHRSKHVPSIGP